MPSTYAHYRFGQDVRKLLPQELRSIVERHLPLYDIGLHGPDILFYYRPLGSNRVNQQGYQLHGRIAADFFRHGLELAEQAQDPEPCLAYLIGFVCHFALDSECHGYIEYKIRRSGITHTELETEFDRMLLEQRQLDPMETCLTQHIAPREGDTELISRFFENVTPEQIETSLQSMIRYNRLLQADSPRRRKAVCLLLKITGNYQEMHGLLIPETPRPGCEDSDAELLRRMKGAVPVACRLAENLYRTFRRTEALSDRFHRTYGPDTVELNRYEGREEINFTEGRMTE